MGEELRRLVAARGQAKGSITRLYNFAKGDTTRDCTLIEITIKKDRLVSTFREYCDLNIDVLVLDPKNNEDFTETEEKYMSTLALLEEQAMANVSKNGSGTEPTQNEISTSRLPCINIPMFSGEVGGYHDFINLFKSVIDSSCKLSQCDKLYYLKSFLEGEAAALLKHLSLSADSYITALQLLEDRYNNKNKLINHHITSLLDLKPTTKCTASALRDIISLTRQHLGALKNLEVPVQHWDLMLICILQRKLDQYTIRCFHLEQGDRLPDLNLFLHFLEQRAAALETVADVGRAQASTSWSSGRRASLLTTAVAAQPASCHFCESKNHRLHQCEKFRLASLSERIKFTNSNKLCQLCLNKHDKKCRFNFKCSICKEKHNTLLHQSKQSGELKQVALSRSRGGEIVLPTIKVRLVDKHNNDIYVRALCDSGSQVSFILSDLAQIIKCNIFDKYTSFSGIGRDSDINTVKKNATVQIFSSSNDYKLNVECCIVTNITSDLPQCEIKTESLNIPSHIKLADPEFYKTQKISILLGCDIFFKILLREQLPIISSGLYVQDTRFGFIVAGKLSHSRQQNTVNKQVSAHVSNSDSLASLENTIQQFWKCEQVSEVFKEASSEHELAEKIFSKSVVLKNNKFQVDLPLKQDINHLNMGSSLSRALQRFTNLEKRFQKDPILFQKYKAFIDEYVALGHAKVIDIESCDLESGKFYFLPHHPVINENSETTKLRVVFDGSMNTNLGFSLNNMLLNGPCVQNELFNILILFRLQKYVLISDIRRMFREVLLNTSHCKLQNILWRNSPHEKIQCIQLQTVTYGLKCSTFLATRCLVELANHFKDQYPLASAALLNNTYVDDIIVNNNNIKLIIETKRQLIELLKLGGFTLHKWRANSDILLSDTTSTKNNTKEIDLCKDECTSVKTLGVTYDIQSDTLNITSPPQSPLEHYTKRQVLSFISRLFDPLGLAGPIIVAAKIIMQQAWLAKINWDALLPVKLNNDFKSFVSNLSKMNTIKAKRNIDTLNTKLIELIGFADASKKAYGCCLYLRIIDKEGKVKVNLLCSKSRINPIKPLSTPQLELNSALLLSQLTKKVYDQLCQAGFCLKVYLYLDSQVVLAWLNTEPTKLPVYVANRVRSSQKLTNDFSWSYVNTNENPADLLSRGVDAHLLQDNMLWWQGPQFLHSADYFHKFYSCKNVSEISHFKVCKAIAISSESDNIFAKYSDLINMKRIAAYVYRFINNCKQIKANRVFGNLTCNEMELALKMIIKKEQAHYFSEELKNLKSNMPIKSKLKSLNPFIDGTGILRVGGRLQNANMSFSQKHPIILPKNSIITRVIINYAHKCLLHAGPKLLFASLSQMYYIIDGLRIIKNIIYKCITCFKLKAKAAEQLMGSLPTDRVTPSRPFEKVGIDFGGPFSVKLHRVRKPIIYKAYIVLFVCFVTKAIHIELVSNMTTECFLQCLKRFIARRNKPSVIYCDNASTFKGANNQLHEFYQLHSKHGHQDKVTKFAENSGIRFSFIPSYSPVFGGLWESGIKSAKYHLKRVVGIQVFTYEELNSIVIQIEGILNSRPLLSLNNVDTDDMSYLTPAHFLTGASLTSYPEQNITKMPINRLSFWKQCTHMVQCFWKTWSKQYLTQLQNRPKWHKSLPNIQKGTLILLKDDNLSPLVWKVARVTETFPGSDGKVRALTVRTGKGSFVRTSITKVCVLPINDTDDSGRAGQGG